MKQNFYGQYADDEPTPQADEPDHHEDAPTPLTRSVTIPPFPVQAFPPSIAAMVAAVSTATQTDPAMAGTSALAVLAACAGGHAEIEVRTGWREPLCLYTATVAGPGERKSSVQAQLTAPLLAVEEELVNAGAAARSEAATRKSVAQEKAQKDVHLAAGAGADADGKMADAIGSAQLADSIEVPPVPRIVADDVTPEAAASLMAEQRGRLAVISAEGGIFDIIAGRYSNSVANLDIWLKGHAGDPVKIDRKNRPPEYIKRPALTLGLMVQPNVLEVIAGHRQFRGRGLLARFLYALPTSKVGHRDINPPPVPVDVSEAYVTAVRELAAGLAGWAGDPAPLMLTATAREAALAIETAVEPTLVEGGELGALADWGAKFVGAVMRIAGLLHLARHGADAGVKTPITAETITAAYDIGRYFRACAINAFDSMGRDAATAEAQYLLDRIESLGVDELSARDMIRAAQRFRAMAEMAPAVTRLLEHGYLVPVEQQTSEPKAGRQPAPRFRFQR